MPITIFKARGEKAINELDLKVNEWLESPDFTGKEEVRQISTAISQTRDDEPLYVLTIWHDVPND
jgi:hypothetical protein